MFFIWKGKHSEQELFWVDFNKYGFHHMVSNFLFLKIFFLIKLMMDTFLIIEKHFKHISQDLDNLFAVLLIS